MCLSFLGRPYFKGGRINLRNGEIVGRYIETEWVPKSEPRRFPSDVLPFKPIHCFRRNIHMYSTALKH